MNVRMIDVARKAGVSKSTVSQYLNGRYDYMSVETKDRIKQAVEEMGFVPNALARSLKMKQTYTIATIVSNILNPFSTATTRGAEDCCNKNGFELILCNADDRPSKEKEYIETLVAKQVDGLIVSTTERNNDLLFAVNKRTPITILGRSVPDINCDTVRVDSYSGIKLAIEHLVSLGHSRLAMFALPHQEVNISPRRERVQAFRALTGEFGLPLKPEWVVEVSKKDEEALVEAVRDVLGRPEPPTAFIGANDLISIALFKALKKRLNLRIPEDVALLSFDDWEWANLLDPPITVVAQPAYEMGYMAAELVLKRIREKSGEYKPEFMVYQPELIARQSCGEK
jgi:DNA-binding LacI/PurR family transcriptional regulator